MNFKGWTGLHWAAWFGSVAIVSGIAGYFGPPLPVPAKERPAPLHYCPPTLNGMPLRYQGPAIDFLSGPNTAMLACKYGKRRAES